MEEIKRHRLYVMHHDAENSILKLTWTPETANMVDQDFKNTLMVFAELAKENRARNLWVDSREFKHIFGDGVLEWRKDNVIPAYSDAGVKKEGFQVGIGGRKMPPSVTETGQKTESFETAEEVLAWFAKD